MKKSLFELVKKELDNASWDYAACHVMNKREIKDADKAICYLESVNFGKDLIKFALKENEGEELQAAIDLENSNKIASLIAPTIAAARLRRNIWNYPHDGDCHKSKKWVIEDDVTFVLF